MTSMSVLSLALEEPNSALYTRKPKQRWSTDIAESERGTLVLRPAITSIRVALPAPAEPACCQLP